MKSTNGAEMKQVSSQIVGWGSYLPSRVVTNDDLAASMETSDEWIRSRTGIGQRHIADASEVSSDLATHAARQALERANLSPQDVDMIILATVTPDNTFPATAARVQAKLGMTRGIAFDISAACAGFIYALSLADNAIRVGQVKTVLIIGVETFSRILDWNDRSTAVLFGDGAGAAVLQARETESHSLEGALPRGVLGCQLHTDGSLYDILKADGGPSVSSSIGRLVMDGQEVFRNAVVRLVSVAQSLLAAHQISIDQLDWIIPHQANLRIINATGERLGFPASKTVITVDKHANTSAASIPLALCTVADQFKPGDLIFIEAIGAGLVWGAALFRW